MDDDIMPNDGTYFLPREPKEREIARKSEKSKVLQDLKMVEELLVHLEQRINFRNSIDSIGVDITDNPALHQKMMHVNQLVKQELEAERGWIKDLIDTHARNRR